MWLNDNEIICDAGLGCENERIDQGRSYIDKNINISNCFFSRYLSYSGYGGITYVPVSSCLKNNNQQTFHFILKHLHFRVIWILNGISLYWRRKISKIDLH